MCELLLLSLLGIVAFVHKLSLNNKCLSVMLADLYIDHFESAIVLSVQFKAVALFLTHTRTFSRWDRRDRKVNQKAFDITMIYHFCHQPFSQHNNKKETIQAVGSIDRCFFLLIYTLAICI